MTHTLINLFRQTLAVSLAAALFFSLLPAVSAQAEDSALVCLDTTNLITNGSFEDQVVSDEAGYQLFNGVTGWAATKVVDGSAADLEHHQGWSGNSAAAGAQYVELDANESVKINQTVATEIGSTYLLSWSFAARHDLGAEHNHLGVEVGNLEVAESGPAAGSAPLAQTDWVRSSYSFAAASANTDISFFDRGPSDSYGTFLDDVQLCKLANPAPVTGTISLTKLAGVPDDELGWVSFAGDWSFDFYGFETEVVTLTNSASNVFATFAAGEPVVVSELEEEGWTLNDVSCTYGYDPELDSPISYTGVTQNENNFTIIPLAGIELNCIALNLQHVVAEEPVDEEPVEEEPEDSGPAEDAEPVVESPVTASGGSSSGRRANPPAAATAVPTVLGESISLLEAATAPMVAGDQVSVVPYGAAGTGHGGTAPAPRLPNLSLIAQLLALPRKICLY